MLCETLVLRNLKSRGFLQELKLQASISFGRVPNIQP